MDQRHPRHPRHPRQNFIDPRQNFTHTTHASALPTQPTNPRHPRDLADSRGILPEVFFTNRFSVENSFCVSFFVTSRKVLATVPFMLSIE